MSEVAHRNRLPFRFAKRHGVILLPADEEGVERNVVFKRGMPATALAEVRRFAGAGFTLALVLMSGLRERLELADVSSVVKGAALTLIIAGILSMAFSGFMGIGK